VEPKYVFEALLTGPQQMPVFSEANLTADEKREIIAYLKSLEEMPEYGGANMGAFGPVSEGLFAWVIGIGVCSAFATWIATHGVRSSKKKGATL
jgi:ubiquinol-cytochrome c reductase cytochrome c subunit